MIMLMAAVPWYRDRTVITILKLHYIRTVRKLAIFNGIWSTIESRALMGTRHTRSVQSVYTLCKICVHDMHILYRLCAWYAFGVMSRSRNLRPGARPKPDTNPWMDEKPRYIVHTLREYWSKQRCIRKVLTIFYTIKNIISDAQIEK